jgi:hypothetical protein
MPSTANLAIYQGDDFAAVVTVTNGTPTPPDLTGCLPQAQIRLGPADSNPTVVVEIAAALNPPNLINLTIPHSVTKMLEGQYAWDLQLTDPTGLIATILAGTVIVTAEITREGP